MPPSELIHDVENRAAARAHSQKQGRTVSYIFIGVLAMYMVVRGLAAAAILPFWFDELQTLAVASQPNMRAMWAALSHLVDSQPIAFHLVEHTVLRLTSAKEIALRLPSILAGPCIALCVFMYVKRRSGELVACLCALLLLSTSLCHQYLIEARSYSVMVAFTALALVCYQRLPSPLWTTLLGVSLFLAGSFHYYAVFSMVPFGLAESLRSVKTRRIRWRVWMALGCGALPLVVFRQWLLKFRGYYGAHFFSSAHFSELPRYYGSYFLTDGVFGPALAALVAAGIIWSQLLRRSGPEAQVPDEVAERVVLLNFVGLPLIGLIILRVVNGGMVDRYFLPTTLGIILGMSYVLSLAGRKATIMFGVFLFCVIGIREYTFWRHPDDNPLFSYDTATSKAQLHRMENLMQDVGYNDLPIVVSNSLLYPQLVYYSNPPLTKRLCFLVDEQRELHYTGNDTNSKILSVLRDFFPARVEDYSKFTTSHQKFLLYSKGLDWDTAAFTDQGFAMNLLQHDDGRVYLVEINPTSPRE